MALWLDGEVEGGGADQFVAGSDTMVPSSRTPVISYFFGFHSRASFSASDIWAEVIFAATISRFLTALSRSFPGGKLEAATLSHIWVCT